MGEKEAVQISELTKCRDWSIKNRKQNELRSTPFFLRINEDNPAY
jgi:hypothetical protein